MLISAMLLSGCDQLMQDDTPKPRPRTPADIANATMENNIIYLNYIDQTIKLRRDEWLNWYEIWSRLNERQ